MISKPKSIYLAGNISSDARTYEWRLEATELLKERYIVVNPAANHFNRALLKRTEGDAKNFLKQAKSESQGILIVKDYQLVANSDIILVNLALITPEKPVIGTLFELAWAWQLKIPVIAIINGNLYCEHPFPKAAISATAESVKEACGIIHEFFED